MCYKVTVDNIWEVKVISNFWRFSQTENHWILSAFHLENCIWDTGHLWSGEGILRRNVIIWMPGCKKNPLHVTIAHLHEAYYFCCALTMSIYWHAIAYAGVWTCVIRNYKILPCSVLPLSDQYCFCMWH